MILVVVEHRDGVLNRASWEAVAAAQQLAGAAPLTIVQLGSAEAASADLATAGVGEVVVVADPALELYTPDGYLAALVQVIGARQPRVIVLAHTYQARDFVPALAARLNWPLVTDVVGIVTPGATFLRQMFQGKLVAEVRPTGDGPYLVTMQIGAFRADQVRRGTTPSALVPCRWRSTPLRSVRLPEAPFREAKQAVDLGQAARIVAVGRGIKSLDRLPVAQSLADGLNAELAASRPICDNGWLPMERQVGSSGQTVAPKLYVALGISGAIQHLVGMKGSRTIVAINKDADAPIFEVADYGIVGDLFEIVPAIVEELKK